MSFQPSPVNWTPPDGLGYSSMRAVTLSGGGIGMIVGAVLIAAVGIGVNVFIVKDSRTKATKAALLGNEGRETTAVVIRKWRTSGKSDRHMVGYRFTAGGDEIHGSASAPRGVWDGLQEGDSLPVRYVPERPEINHPAAWALPVTPLWVPWVMPVLFIWPAGLFVWLIRRDWRLLAEGRPAPGVITKIRHAKQTFLYYDFTLPSGEVRKGKCGGGRRGYGIGTEVCVLYDPDNPRRNAVYPLQLVKLAR